MSQSQSYILKNLVIFNNNKSFNFTALERPETTVQTFDCSYIFFSVTGSLDPVPYIHMFLPEVLDLFSAMSASLYAKLCLEIDGLRHAADGNASSTTWKN